MSYQRGDRIVTGQGGRNYHLRLTFGALAWVCDVLDVDSFSALAEQMRKRPKEAIKAFADAMICASGCETEVEAADLPELSEAVSGMIESSFHMRPPQSQPQASTAPGDRPSPKEGANLNALPPPSGGGGSAADGGGGDAPIPFTSWLKIAVQIYRLSPAEFWAMSLSDFFSLLPEPQTPPGRETLSQLMKKFPDEAPK